MMTRVLLPIMAGILLSSCSSYQRDFRNASISKSQPGPTGTWKGRWKSEVNGHNGPLWCIVTRDASRPDHWNFRYRAGWGILQFGDYTHRITGKAEKNGNLPVKGKMTLPNNFGTYAVEGLLTDERFTLRFKGNGDRGTMILSRP